MIWSRMSGGRAAKGLAFGRAMGKGGWRGKEMGGGHGGGLRAEEGRGVDESRREQLTVLALALTASAVSAWPPSPVSHTHLTASLIGELPPSLSGHGPLRHRFAGLSRTHSPGTRPSAAHLRGSTFPSHSHSPAAISSPNLP